MDLTETFEANVRRAIGIAEEAGGLPRIDRLAFYRARVDACAADGSTVDVTFEDERLEAAQAVPLRAPFAGAECQVATGAWVLVGWERGDPARVYASPTWESGTSLRVKIAGTTKVQITSTALTGAVELGPNPIAQVLVKGSLDGMGMPVQQFPAAALSIVKSG